METKTKTKDERVGVDEWLLRMSNKGVGGQFYFTFQILLRQLICHSIFPSSIPVVVYFMCSGGAVRYVSLAATCCLYDRQEEKGGGLKNDRVMFEGSRKKNHVTVCSRNNSLPDYKLTCALSVQHGGGI